MIVDSSLVLSQFAKKRNVPVKYDRNLVAATVQAMQRVEEIRQRRERVFTKRRLAGKVARDRQREADRKVVATGEHLIRKELRDREEGVPMVAQTSKTANRVHGEDLIAARQKKKTRLLVDGGAEEEVTGLKRIFSALFFLFSNFFFYLGFSSVSILLCFDRYDTILRSWACIFIVVVTVFFPKKLSISSALHASYTLAAWEFFHY